MAITWILIAHGSAGKILSVKRNSEEITTIKEFTHLKTAKKTNEPPGEGKERVVSFPTPTRQAIDYSDEIENHERQVFAKEIAHFLDKGLFDHRFERLIIVASPNLLGELRKTISDPVRRLIAEELHKDLISQGLSNEELVQKIKDDLELPSL